MPDLVWCSTKIGAVVDLQHLVDGGVERPRQAPNGADRRIGLVAFDLADDRFGDP